MQSTPASTPILKRIEGSSLVNLITPITDAQFLIGKSWDVSLNLQFESVSEKHCTIEKVDTGKWTIVAHDRASTRLNGETLTSGLPVLLKCGDFLQVASQLLFKFECFSVTCDRCNPPSSLPDNTVTEDQNQKRRRFESEQLKDKVGHENANNSSLPDDTLTPQSRCKRLKSSEHSNNRWKNDRKKARNCCSQLLEIREELEKHLNNDQLLNGVVTTSTTIEMLQEQLNQLHKDFEAVLSHRNNLTCEVEDLRNRISQHVENARSLSSENKKLQLENKKLLSDIAELKEKRRELESDLDVRMTVAQNMTSSGDQTDDLKQTSEAVMEVMTKWTDLLQSEFKCVICHEILVEAVVTNCSHTFCQYCLQKWKAIKPNCPTCMNELISKETKNLVVDSYLTNILPFALPDVRANWLQVAEERRSLVKRASRKRSFDSSTCTSSSSSSTNPRVRFNFPYPYLLLQLHQRLTNNSDNFFGESIVVDDSSEAVIDLTSNDEAD